MVLWQVAADAGDWVPQKMTMAQNAHQDMSKRNNSGWHFCGMSTLIYVYLQAPKAA